MRNDRMTRLYKKTKQNLEEEHIKPRRNAEIGCKHVSEGVSRGEQSWRKLLLGRWKAEA